MILGVLQQVLNEFFLDVQKSNISLYAGDLFESSHFKLTDVFLKPTLINLLQLPFELSAGYVGNITVEGLVGAVAGWPLEISISDLCLVLKPNHVQWDKDLLIRYAKELLIAICQCFGVPAAVKKDNSSFTLPVKWIWSRIQPVKADTIIQLERFHVRVESPRSDNLFAYGLYIPIIRFAPREMEHQILQRRQQPWFKYPEATDNYLSKLLTIENISLYTDLDASPYWITSIDTKTTSAAAEHFNAVTNSPSCQLEPSSRQYTLGNALERFKKQTLMPFVRAEHCEFVFARVVWAKLDFERAQPNVDNDRGSPRPVLTAFDIATEAIELNINFDQIAAMLVELEHVVAYCKRARTWQWRPSCIDRDRCTPINVRVSASALLPLPMSDEESATVCHEKVCKSRPWLRNMWRYAFRCIVHQQPISENKSGDKERNPRKWWYFDDIVGKESQNIRRQRYMHLYVRNLSPDAMEIALYGRRKALLGLGFLQDQSSVDSNADKALPSPPSPRRRPLPQYDALSHEELWELSDFVATMSVYEQRICRALAEQQLRRDSTSAPPSPTRSSSTMGVLVAPREFTSDHVVQHSRRYSVDSVFTRSMHDSVSDANVSRHKRGSTIACSVNKSSTRLASPTKPRLRSSSICNQLSPTRPFQEWIQKPHVSRHTTSRIERQLFPAWLYNVFRVLPLFNWHTGPVAIRLRIGANNLDCAQSTRNEVIVKICMDGCSGAMLHCRTPFLRILMEARIGLLNVTMNGQPQLLRNNFSIDLGLTEYNWISSNYIRSPEDGFLYIGLKYSAHEVSNEGEHSDEEVSLKGKLCIGSVTINYDEGAMYAIVGQATPHEFQLTNLNLVTLTHFSLFRDACHKLIALLPTRRHFPRHNTSPRVYNKINAADGAFCVPVDQQELKRKARTTHFLNALLLRSSTIEVEVGTLELKVSAYTSHVEKPLGGQIVRNFEAIKPTDTCEDVNIRLQAIACRLLNRPSMDECILDVAGVRVVYRSTQRGRAAAIRHITHFVNF